jgi:hypothetical protein
MHKAGSFGSMLTVGQEGVSAAAAVRAAMLRCGVVLQAEFEAQAKDFLADMPCHLLISALRQLMEQRTRERGAMERLHAVVSEISKELDMIQQSVDDTGVWWKRKDAAVEVFGRASKKAMKMLGMRDLVLAQMKIQQADDDDDDGHMIAALGVQLAAREAELREARAQKRLALSELAAVEPDFPEVMVHLEKALPRELLGVWRPDSALEDMFVQREKLAGSHPLHNVWRCSDGEGGEEFAVKEHPSPGMCVATPGRAFRFPPHHSGPVVQNSAVSAGRAWTLNVSRAQTCQKPPGKTSGNCERVPWRGSANLNF